MLPNIQSTDTLIDLLNSSIPGVSCRFLYGSYRWTPSGYAGSSQRHNGIPFWIATALIMEETQTDEAWCYRAVSLHMDQKDWQSNHQHNNALKFHGMKPLIPIVHSSLIRIWPCNFSYSSINKTKTVFQRGTISMFSISIPDKVFGG